MNNFKLNSSVFGMGLIALSFATACNSSNSNTPANNQAPGATASLYNKYGGQATIRKVVDDAVNGVIADCTENPFFTQNIINFDDVNSDGQGHGTNGHDTVDRLKSCLDAQFTAAFGGPSQYVGTTSTTVPSRSIPGLTYDCEDMSTAHAGLGIPASVFDQFITDVGGVMKKDGVSDADITTVATKLMGFKTNIADANNPQSFNFQPGQPTDQSSVACSVASPSPTPSSSPSANPSPSPSPSPSASPSPTPSSSPSSTPSGMPGILPGIIQ